jgi:hypothetical protein
VLNDKKVKMNEIPRTELQDIISKLDTALPKDGAQVKLDQYGGGPDEGVIVANERGYLRLGVEFLKAAFAEQKKDENGNEKAISIDLEYLITTNSAINFDWFERTEEVPVEVHKPTVRENLTLVSQRLTE